MCSTHCLPLGDIVYALYVLVFISGPMVVAARTQVYDMKDKSPGPMHALLP